MTAVVRKPPPTRENASRWPLGESAGIISFSPDASSGRVGFEEARDAYAHDHNMGGAVFRFGLISLVIAGFATPYFIAIGPDISARAAAIAGVLAVLVCGALLRAILVAAFAVAFAALFLWTIMSAIIFVPLRIGHTCWLAYHKIRYRCPYDECRYNGLPIHVCSCGAEYPDLEPNRYGILHHTCHHAPGRVTLPTLFGRNRLPRLCGGCRRPLLHSSIGVAQSIDRVRGGNARSSLSTAPPFRRDRSQGSLLPADGIPDHDTSAARAVRRCPDSRAAFHPEVCLGDEETDRQHPSGYDASSGELVMATQYTGG